jgi:hypothetical protein
VLLYREYQHPELKTADMMLVVVKAAAMRCVEDRVRQQPELSVEPWFVGWGWQLLLQQPPEAAHTTPYTLQATS